MNKEEKERQLILQHKEDAQKVLTDLDTMECNIEGGKFDWAQIVEVRKGHINNFILSLEEKEKEFEHFK